MGPSFKVLAVVYFVLYKGVTFMEYYRLRVCEKTVVRKMFGSKTEDAKTTGSSTVKSFIMFTPRQTIGWARHVACMGDIYRVCVKES